MRKSIFITLTALFLCVSTVFAGNSDMMQMYTIYGDEISVSKTETEAYKKDGWFENKSDVIKIMYAPDGREIKIYIAETEAYKNVGWFENKSDVTSSLVSPDGTKIVVYKTEVESYMALGWTPAQNSEIDPAKPMVSLTFDDGPRPQSTNRILDCLQKYNARATFFVIGNLAEVYTDTLRKMNSLNCQIGNHTYSHPQLTSLSSYNISVQLNTTSEIIRSATGNYPTVVRPPYGSYNQTVLSSAGKPLILWSIDTLDWQSRNATSVTNVVLSQVQDGDIILMHDIYDSTATAAENIIPALISRGYQLVTVDELARYKGVTMSARYSYGKFR